MIRGSDGLDYEDLAARLLGEPAKNRRNEILGPDSPHSRPFKEAFRETYDHYEEQGYPPLECHRAAFTQACISATHRDDFAAATAYAYSALRGTRARART